ncbi:MAG: phosphoribosylglycinamide formyltransferase [Alphaproteobacteria bacterium]|jgi:phosphoribosylglycinamide formyltransferase 1|nr:phosphoribosylglycinamide formyltransferase [Rhodospirillaceae bacterium]MBT6203437.1 phosphoribosylglycinamide formyltransferase [Rhodospirillaceae bacterium]MBT6510022.1 phosphoribosylglycinamide formyltransferase [Rhodospirillaceae bacterium]MBT7647663.1 phosphoribosylglycinamide formyltransferase [Rhodospirillaceae bacterium]MDG2479544.1 phosphoribosylglycinamide formyltransferase [Alphaproteobacteria bacterium]
MKVAVFISGRGTNLQALIDVCAQEDTPAEIGLVVSNRPAAQGLARASAAGIPTVVVDHKTYDDRESFDAALDTAVTRAGCDFICLAGFMRILTEDFTRKWRDRMLNIHPSLIPAFPGLNCHARAIEAGVMISGCTVHFARPELDAGPVIAQAAVPVLPDDDEEALAARILEAEHRIYPMALKLIAQGRIRIVNERVRIQDGSMADGMLVNPAKS